VNNLMPNTERDPAQEAADYDAIRAEQDRPRTISDKSRHFLQECTVVDMTEPMSLDNLTQHKVLEKARSAGFDFVSVTVGSHSPSRPNVLEAFQSIGAVRRYVDERPDNFLFVQHYDDILSAKETRKTGVGVHFQETNQVNGNLDLVWVYRQLGISHMLLAYNQRNMVADGCSERTDSGLSRFGQALVKEMRKVGILCDGSHSGHRSTMEAMEIYEGPFIFSHSNCKAVFDHYRNIADDQIKACAATGGVIGINGVGRFLDDPYARAESMFRHIDHVISLVGSQHVGIGLDRMADPDKMWRWLNENAAMWPANRGRSLQYATFAPHDAVGEVVDLMLAHGYGTDAITGYLGRNFLRVLKQVWK
jgi:membrane dipeptidase